MLPIRAGKMIGRNTGMMISALKAQFRLKQKKKQAILTPEMFSEALEVHQSSSIDSLRSSRIKLQLAQRTSSSNFYFFPNGTSAAAASRLSRSKCR